MMDEYVSRSAVLTKGLDVKSIPDDLIGAGIMVWLDGAKNRIRRLPAADVAPVVHGQWLHSMKRNRKIYKTVAIAAVILLAMVIILLLTGCSEADKVNANISKQADYFESERRITVYNARTDKIILEAEGYMSISNNGSSELVVTCKVGPDEYKKNYIYLNDYVLYVVEDISGTHTDAYHYKMYFHTEFSIDVGVKP